MRRPLSAAVAWGLARSRARARSTCSRLRLSFLFPLLASAQVFKVIESNKSVDMKFYMTRIMPVGFLMALTLLCGNVSYLYLTVAFIQMLKAFTPIITMVTLFLFRMETPTKNLIASVVFIAFGTLLASLGEGSFSVIGVVIMMSSEVFESVRLVMTQVLLVGLKFNPSASPTGTRRGRVVRREERAGAFFFVPQSIRRRGRVRLREAIDRTESVANDAFDRHSRLPLLVSPRHLARRRCFLGPVHPRRFSRPRRSASNARFFPTSPILAVEGLMYLAPACSFWLVLGSLFTELGRMRAENALATVTSHPYQFLGAAAMGFGVNSLAYIVIQTASSLTLKVLGTVKNALVVYLGVIIFSERVSTLQAVGYAISLVAFFFYQRIKMAQVASGQAAGGGAPPPQVTTGLSASRADANKEDV